MTYIDRLLEMGDKAPFDTAIKCCPSDIFKNATEIDDCALRIGTPIDFAQCTRCWLREVNTNETD